MHPIKRALIALILAFLPVGSALAFGKPWSFTVTPYLWGAGIDGELSHQQIPLTFEPSVGFSDIWSNLDAGGMLAFEGRGERSGVLADLMVVDTSTSVRIPVLNLLHVPVDVSADTTTALLAYTYRFHESNAGHVDAVVGIRYWSVRTQFTYIVPPSVPDFVSIPRQYNLSDRAEWADVHLGLKGSHFFNDRVFASGMALVGKGGADFSTDVMVALGYRLGGRSSLLLGYRHLQTDFDKDGFKFDLAIHGPAVGVDVRF